LRCYGYQPADAPVFVLCGDNARFMNHSSKPNADDIGDLTIACRDIAKGEEITCDYAKFDRGFAERDFILATAQGGARRAA
ncbi:MAG: SET domain-containing protein, partial [Bauldia sp.]|uniref:SET domain-containing protein-lysine N-methyltransferase n=1 Tax=Bauldia sp. TaxID=2575872 RepID=UPI001DE59471